MAVRLAHVDRVAREIAKAAKDCASVRRVLHPAFDSCPGHDLWKRDFRGASGTFSLELDDAAVPFVDAALDKLKTIAIGASWGGTHSLMVPMTVDRPDRPGASPTYLRLSVGLESPADIMQDVTTVLSNLDVNMSHLRRVGEDS